MNERFFCCKACGAILGLIHSEKPLAECCGRELSPLLAKTAEEGQEKHLPLAAICGDRVSVAVGESAHPMEEEHHIQWIYLRTDRGGQRKQLSPDRPPRAEFALVDEKPLAVYAYCNRHGLWKKEL